MIYCYLRTDEKQRKKHLINVITPEQFSNPIYIPLEDKDRWIPIYKNSSIEDIDTALYWSTRWNDKTLGKILFELSDYHI